MPPYGLPCSRRRSGLVYRILMNCSQAVGLLRGTCGMRRSGEEGLIPVNAVYLRAIDLVATGRILVVCC